MVILIGYSGHGFVAHGIFKAAGLNVQAYCDSSEKILNPFDLEYLGSETSENAQISFVQNDFFISIGDNNIRKKVFNTMAEKDLYPINAIHPSAIIDDTVQLASAGIMIAPGAVINVLCKIGIGVICNTGSLIDHECVIGDFCHIAPGAVLCGNVTVGNSTFIGANAVVRQGVTIGNNVLVGAGSVVVKDIPDNYTVIGNPAAKI